MGLARVLMAVMVVGLIGADPAFAGAPIPAGFRVVNQMAVAPGVERLTLERDKPPLVVNVARLAPNAAVSLRAVLSNDAVAGLDPIVERTSTMCRRVHCLLAVNGDFAGGDDQPLGGLLSGGELLRTPSPTHLQLSVGKDGSLSAGELDWSGTLVPTDLAPLTFAGVNVGPAADGITLYTAAYGPALATTGPATVVGFRNIEPAGRLVVGQTTMVEIIGLWEQPAGSTPSPIPADGGVLAGRGSAVEVLRSLWSRVQSAQVSSRALLRLDAQAGVAESLGASPILIRDGSPWFADTANDFTRGRQPRTLVGWNPTGEKLLVTVDGRQPETSVGMTLAEAADLL
ncbi:MAG TPA: phosphodiester glycosidase family protein, partial [Acidimicrobiia bacterium]|nr:phosphodiester glycosidase family protein [Acidimicrobiia bacterium]